MFPPGSGTTALHLAASLSRTDVVNLLLEQEGIDDSLRDNQGRTCLEVARGKETIRAIKGGIRSFRVNLRYREGATDTGNEHRLKSIFDCLLPLPPP